MVGDPAFWKIVGAESLRTVTPTDLAFSCLGTFGIEGLALGVEKPSTQHPHRLGPILVLRFLVLLGDDDPGRDMRDAHRRIGGVDVLTTRARRAIDIDAQILVLDLDRLLPEVLLGRIEGLEELPVERLVLKEVLVENGVSS